MSVDNLNMLAESTSQDMKPDTELLVDVSKA